MDTIMVIVDRFTKMIRLKATMTNISSEGMAKIYWDKYGSFMEFQGKYSVIEDHSLHQNSWKNFWKH